jgi:hypothetical protein
MPASRTCRPGVLARIAWTSASRYRGRLRSYLATERDLGRIAADADVASLAPTLIGAGHRLFAGRDRAPPGREVDRVVAAVVAGAVVRT